MFAFVPILAAYEWLQRLSYSGIFLVLLAAGFGAPMPEDIPLLTAGILCHVGAAKLRFMLPVALAGVLIGDVTLFALGRRFGDHILEHRFSRRVFRRSTLNRAKQRIRDHGAKIILAARFTPGARAITFTTAGVVGIPWWKFLAVNGSAAMLSVPTLVLIGYMFGEHGERALHYVRGFEYVIVTALVLLVAAVVAIRITRQRRRVRRLRTWRALANHERHGAAHDRPGPPAPPTEAEVRERETSAP